MNAGSGGTFVVNTTGDITVNTPITATSGLSSGVPSGDGGTVTLSSSGGAVNVNQVIEVSSREGQGEGAQPPFRLSTSGGTLTLHSGLTSGTGIFLGTGGQLLARADGTVNITTAGSDISLDGTIDTSAGALTVQQTGTAGSPLPLITFGDNANITAGNVAIGALGDLQVGSAVDTVLHNATTAVTVNVGHDLVGSGLTNGGLITGIGNGNIGVVVGHDISLTGALDFSAGNANGGDQTAGFNVTYSSGGLFNVAGGISASSEVYDITSGGNVDVHSGSDMSLDAGAFLRAGLHGSNGDAGNINFASGGAISAGLLAVADLAGASGNAPNPEVDNGANVTVSAATTYTTTATNPTVELLLRNSPGTTLTGTVNTGGNLSFTTGGDVTLANGGAFTLLVDNRGSTIGTGGNITASIGGNFSAGNDVTVQIDNSHGGTITNGGNMTFHVAGDFTTPGNAVFLLDNQPVGTAPNTIGSSVAVDIAAKSFTVGGALTGGILNTGGSIGANGNDYTFTLTSAGAISVTDTLDIVGSISAGGDVSAKNIAVTDLTSTGNINAGANGITPATRAGDIIPSHVFTANAVTSTGGINFNGSTSPAAVAIDGGTLTLNVGSLTTAGASADITGPITFDGGQTTDGSAGGSGGTFNVNATGAIDIASPISATSGAVDPTVSGSSPSGNGGTVNLVSTGGTVSVSDTIKVSSADTAGTRRSVSKQGGNVGIRSGKSTTSGRVVAVDIANTSQLLSLLDAAAPGPGGKITIKATGANSDVNVNGTVRADRGQVDIRHTGDGGNIALGGAASVTSITMSADVIKAAALGSNGTLTIGSGTISADSMLYLYATGSNGQLNFIASCTLNSGSAMHLAANTVTIQPSVVVTIGGAGGKANVYTNNANYTGFGGNASTTGTFGGNGANNPQPLSSAPTLPTPPPGP